MQVAQLINEEFYSTVHRLDQQGIIFLTEEGHLSGSSSGVKYINQQYIALIKINKELAGTPVRNIAHYMIIDGSNERIHKK